MSKLKDFFEDYIEYPIRFVYYRIHNLIRWFPIIWRDRDWDDWYIYTILETKLKHQAEYIGTKDRHTRAKRDAEIMMTCVRLIQKVKEEVYDSEWFDYEVSNFHWDDIEDMPEHKQLRIEHVSNEFQEYFLRYPLEYKRVMSGKGNVYNIKGPDDLQAIAMEISRRRQVKARRILFKIIHDDIDGWWD